MRVLLLSALLVTTAACTSGPRSELASDIPPPFAQGERAAPEMAAPVGAPETVGSEPLPPASYASPPPVAAAPPQVASAPIPLTPPPAPMSPPPMEQPMAMPAEPMPAAPPPEPAPAPAVAAAPTVAGPFGFSVTTPAPSRLTLSNFSFDKAHVVAVATASPDCNARREGETEVNFELPLNGSRIIEVPPGSDVCWRREIEAVQTGGARRWSAWNRAFVSVAGAVDSRL